MTATDLFNFLVLTFLFNAGLIFMVLAFLIEDWSNPQASEWPKNIIFHMMAAIFFFVLGVIVPTTATTYYPVGWVFLILGIANFVFGAIFGVAGFYEVYKREEWEREETFSE